MSSVLVSSLRRLRNNLIPTYRPASFCTHVADADSRKGQSNSGHTRSCKYLVSDTEIVIAGQVVRVLQRILHLHEDSSSGFSPRYTA